jgi:bifunctional non-homologous end joining protein LigD
MRLSRRPEPFNHPDWLFELKLDGFRALAFMEDGNCELVSRNGNTFASFRDLASQLPAGFRGDNGILDGEIVCLDGDGYPQFEDLMFRRGELFFMAFDLLWLNGADLRQRPLMERKRLLRRSITRRLVSRLRYLDHVERSGCELFRLTCERNLEGIIAKPIMSIYDTAKRKSSWTKIKNPDYSQVEGREELFEELRA